MSLEEFASANKSQQVFDADIAPHGIFPCPTATTPANTWYRRRGGGTGIKDGDTSPNGLLRGIGRWFVQPTLALPLDIFRVLVGFISLVFFLSLFYQAGDFSDPDGLIDHQLSRELFPFTRFNFFPVHLNAAILHLIFLIACVCCLALILGYRVKLAAGIAYVIAVCTYRSNYLVMYVDDAMVHLMLFWMLLLPIGHTLRLSEWLVHRGWAWEQWKNEWVLGGAVRCFLWNISLIYATSGLWKWTSPMWRNGTALYAVLKLPIAYQSAFWGPEHLTVLKAFNYLTLILEPLFPSIMIISAGHPAKWAMVVALLVFHLTMLATLQIPYANLACIAAMIILLRNELSTWLWGAATNPPRGRHGWRYNVSAVSALIFVTILTLAMLSAVGVREWRMPTPESAREAENEKSQRVAAGFETIQRTLLGMLWSVGIAQEYQLFNWIDYRNYQVHYEIFELQRGSATRKIESFVMFPRSPRSVLLQTYLHGVTWAPIPSDRQPILKEGLLLRFARRYCREYQPHGVVTVYSLVQRTDPHDPDGGTGHRRLLMSFSCERSEARMEAPDLVH